MIGQAQESPGKVTTKYFYLKMSVDVESLAFIFASSMPNMSSTAYNVAW